MKNDDLQQAAEMLRKAEQVSIEQCSLEIETALKKYDCAMVPQIILRGGQLIPHVLIVSRKDGTSNARVDRSNGNM